MAHSDLPDAGRVPHHILDLVADAWLRHIVHVHLSQADISNPPTAAELNAALGTPAQVGVGYTAIVDDAGAGVNVYLVISTGTAWWYTDALVLAV
jgi:hypothetical protein